jgi:hypothetical protein
MASVRLIAGLAIVGAMASACKSTTTPPVPVPTTLSLSVAAISLASLGDIATVTATVKDQNGATMTGQTVTWGVADATVASLNATTGTTVTVTGLTNGSTTVTAASGGLTGQVSVVVEQVATQIVKISGDAQTAVVGDTLALPLTVEIRDSRGRPVPGGTGGRVVNSVVGFNVTAGGGTMVSQSATVGADGRASSRWVLGGAAGQQQGNAALATNIASVSFLATGTVAAADSLVVVSGADQQGTVGAPLTDSVVARVVDRFGNGVAGWTVDFTANDAGASASPASSFTDSIGRAATQWTLGAAEGAQTLTVAAFGLTKGSPATVNATAVDPVVSTLAKFEGDAQTGLVGKAVNIPPAVRVEDQFGNGVPDVVVTFAVSVGAGSVTGAVDTTGADGIARVGSWTIDAAAGPNGLTASSPGVTSVEFSATGQTAAFDIVVRYFGTQTPTASQQAAFAAAAAKWVALIFGDLDNVSVSNLDLQVCAGADSTLSNLTETIDDLVIYAKVGPIDGAGGILGQAGPCYFRTGGSTPGLPLIGMMVFDEADLANLEASGQLELVIVHEMGHVLGFGSFWNLTVNNVTYFSLLSGAGGADPYFTGANGRAAFDRVGGTAYVAGPKVPVENTGGAGTRDSHWRESVFDRELMTGYLDPGTNNPLSIVSVGSLWDMGYLVNYADADAFTWPAPPALRSPGPVLEMKDDVFRGLVYGVDPSGRVVTVVDMR